MSTTSLRKNRNIKNCSLYQVQIFSPKEQKNQAKIKIVDNNQTIHTYRSQQQGKQSLKKSKKYRCQSGNLFKRQLSSHNVSKNCIKDAAIGNKYANIGSKYANNGNKYGVIDSKRCQNFLVLPGIISKQLAVNQANKKSPRTMQNTMNIPIQLGVKIQGQITRQVRSARLHRERKRSWDYLCGKYPLFEQHRFMFHKQQQPTQQPLKQAYIVFCKQTLKFKKLVLKDELKINYQPLKHDNILNIDGRLSIYGATYFVQDKKQSVSITDIIQKYHLPYKQSYLKKKILSFLNAMICLHQRQIIHNRILPENICISKQGELLIDLLAISQDVLTQNQKINSFYFFSPELLKKGEISKKNDVWALGCLLLYLTTGTIKNSKFHPYSQSYCDYTTIEELKLIKQLKLKYGKPSDSDPLQIEEQKLLSEEIKHFINHCLKINPKHRVDMIDLNFNQEFLQQ